MNVIRFEEKMKALNTLILEYFKVMGKDTAKPKNLMPYLIEKGFYRRDHSEGLPLRKDLRKLD